MSNKKINIVIIDDEDQILTMLSKFLSREPNYTVNNVCKSAYRHCGGEQRDRYHSS